VRWENGAVSAVGADLSTLGSEASGQWWRSIFVIDGWVHAAGYNRRIMTRTPNGAWSLAYDGQDSNGFDVVTGLRADEVIAAGWPGPEGTVQVRFDGGSWGVASGIHMRAVRTSWVKDSSTIYFGGSVNTGSESPTLERATRL